MKIFLSYDHRDVDTARELSKQLLAEGFEVWDPGIEIFPGDNASRAAGEALESADVLLVLLSPDAAASRWVRWEIEYALGAERFENRLIPVVVRATDDVPWILRSMSLVRLDQDPAGGRAQVIARLRDIQSAA